MRTMRFGIMIYVFGCALSCAMLSGCKTVSAPAGPTATSPYVSAALKMNSFAGYVNTAQNTEISLYNSRAIPADVHRRIQQGFLALDQAGPNIDAAIAAASSGDSIAKINAALILIDAISANTVGLPANVTAEISSVISVVKALLNDVLTTIPKFTSEVHNVDRGTYFAGRNRLDGGVRNLQTDRSGSRRRWTTYQVAV